MVDSSLNGERVLLAHGGGGRMSHDLIQDVIFPALQNEILARMDDGACVEISESSLVVTTDSYVVDPLVFPGGDIGRLAACGTINDLAMQGAEPRYLTCALIIEEGLDLSLLRRIMASLSAVVREVGASVIAGDTKVVDRGKGAGVYINTTGVGVRSPNVDCHACNAEPGDAVLLTGTLGDHGTAIMNEREELGFSGDLVSDVAPLWPLVREMLALPVRLRVLRDPTRGGVVTALCDIAVASGVGIRVKESSLPIRPEVRGVCDLLGLDPLSVANEGKALVVCPQEEAPALLSAIRQHPLGKHAVQIGTVTQRHASVVVLETAIGGERIITPPVGDDLPRIC